MLLANETVENKNWEGMVNALEQRMIKWRGLLVQLSYRGCVLVLNNVLASMLWHHFKAVHAPESLVKNRQRILIEFLWSGKHWVRPGVLSLPLEKGGQGLADLISKIMTFRTTAIKRLPATWTFVPGLEISGQLSFELSWYPGLLTGCLAD